MGNQFQKGNRVRVCDYVSHADTRCGIHIGMSGTVVRNEPRGHVVMFDNFTPHGDDLQHVRDDGYFMLALQLELAPKEQQRDPIADALARGEFVELAPGEHYHPLPVAKSKADELVEALREARRKFYEADKRRDEALNAARAADRECKDAWYAVEVAQQALITYADEAA